MRSRRGAAVGLVGALVAALSVIGIDGVGTGEDAGASSPHLSVTVSLLTFGSTTLGTVSAPDTFTLTNGGATTDTIDLQTDDLTFTGPAADDYAALPGSNCPGNGTSTIVLGASASCLVDVYFAPGARGQRNATMEIHGSADTSSGSVSISLEGTGSIGYYQVDDQGNVAVGGDAGYYGGLGGQTLNQPIVAITPTGDDGGYWLVAADGGVFTFGDALFYGSAGNLVLNQPIVGMARTSDAAGYWLVAADGGVFTYGDAQFYGSTGNLVLNQPIVGMAPTPDGGGYWLVAADGGVFTYGDAQFYGSTGNLVLNQPIVGMAPTPDGGGYWLVASDGGIFAYGDAQFYGSTGNLVLNQPIVGMAAMPTGNGYWLSAADGGLFNYGDAPFFGSAVGAGLGQVVGMASDGGPTLQAQFDVPALRRAHLEEIESARPAVPREH